MGLVACGSDVTVTGGTTSTGNGGGSASSSSGGTGECAGATPILAADGTPSGFSRCPDGTIHRVEPATCNPDIGVPACTGTEMMIACKSDAECTDKPHGKCGSFVVDGFGGATTQCSCTYPCANDAECGAGQVCVCAGVTGATQTASFCAPAGCVTGADCASGECGLSIYPNGCYTDVELACRASSDACRLDSDCPAGTGQTCRINGQGAPWACLGTTCAIGRPFVVEGEARAAAPAARADWIAAAVTPSLEGLDGEAREALARHWLEVGALEHASVASFARFTLELLAIGAPADLVAGAQRAGLDEVEHARLAYALASAYAGRALGPGPLDLGPLAIAADARSLIRALVVEGCVGETLGVAEALAIAASVRDPALAAAHARIAADEQRHAELSWRALAHLVTDDDTARFAAACFAEAIAAASRDPEPRAFTLPEHGLLSAAALGAIRRQALAAVVAPCAEALRARPRVTGAAAIV